MHAALFSNPGCSQVLLLGFLSRHVHSITLRLQRGAVRPGLALGCQTSLRLEIKGIKEKLLPSPEIRWTYVPCAQTPFDPLSTRWPVFALGSASRSGCETLPRVRRCASFVPRRRFDIVTTGGYQTIKKWIHFFLNETHNILDLI